MKPWYLRSGGGDLLPGFGDVLFQLIERRDAQLPLNVCQLLLFDSQHLRQSQDLIFNLSVDTKCQSCFTGLCAVRYTQTVWSQIWKFNVGNMNSAVITGSLAVIKITEYEEEPGKRTVHKNCPTDRLPTSS